MVHYGEKEKVDLRFFVLTLDIFMIRMRTNHKFISFGMITGSKGC